MITHLHARASGLWRRMARLSLIALAALPGCEAATAVSEKVDGALASTRDTGAAPLVLKHEPELRIRILKGVNKVRVDGPVRLVVRPVGGGKTAQMTTPLVITSGGTGVRVWETKGSALDWAFGTNIEILTQERAEMPGVSAGGQPAPSELIRLEGVRYPGYLIVRPAWQDYPEKMDVVAIMGIESYLPGVLAHELMTDWPRQAFEAQAVVARSYALHERDRAAHEGRAFDVEDTTMDQVFGGATQLVVANEAVHATRGMILTDHGGLLRAYYSSTCGGRPSSAAEVWPTGPGYEFNRAKPLQGQPRKFACQGSKYYRWQADREDAELGARVRAWARATKHAASSIARIRDVKVESRNAAMRPTRYRVRDSQSREFVLSAEEFRNACNQSVGNLSALSEGQRVLSGDVEVEVWADKVRIRGRGWGHGVGLCQHCARGFADQGWDWRMMMKEFYPGAGVVKAY